MRFTLPRLLARHSRLMFATAIVIAIAATHVAAQFGTFSGAFEGELWGVSQERALANDGAGAGTAYLNGTLYVSDQANGTVVAYASNGAVVTTPGNDWNDNAGATLAGLEFVPNELAVTTVTIDGDDTAAILVSDAVTRRVAALNEFGEILFVLQLERPGFVGAVGGMTGVAMSPGAKWVLAADTLALQGSFVAGWTNEYETEGAVLAYRNLSAFSPVEEGQFAPVATAVLDGTEGNILAPHDQLPFGMVFDPAGNLYTIDTNTERLNVYNAAFGHRFTFGVPSTEDEGTDNFNQPYQLVFMPDSNGGRLIVADSDNHRLVAYRPNLANNRVDLLFTMEPFGDAWPRSLALDASTGRLAVTELGSSRFWILETPALAAFNIKVLDGNGAPATTVCSGSPYRIQFSLTVPAGRTAVANVVPTLAIDGEVVSGTPVAEGTYAGSMNPGDVATYTYMLDMDADVSGDLAIEAGATSSAANVLARQAVMSVSDCSGLPPTMTATPSIAPQVSGWTGVPQGDTLTVTLAATDDEGVQSIEYQIFGQNSPGVTVPPVTYTAPLENAQQVTLSLPEFGYTKIRYRASDSANRWSTWQELEVRIQLVVPRLSIEGSTPTFTVGTPVGTGYQFSASGLPPPVTINPNTGLIGGTLTFTSAGDYAVRVTETCIGGPGATCTIGATSFVEFDWVVTNANQPPIVEALTAPFVVDEGAPFSLPIVGYDPDGDAAYFTVFGHSTRSEITVLPSTVTIDSATGVISGYFPFGSDEAYEIFVGLSECSLASQPAPCDEDIPGVRLATLLKFTMAVTPVNQPPFAVTPFPQANAEGDTVAPLQIVGSDPDNEPLTYTAVNLPPGLSINPTTGLITGTIGYNAVRTPYVVVIEINDTDAVSAPYQFDFVWTVANTNRPPTVSAVNRTNAEGDTVAFGVTANDPDGDTLTYSATGMPAGITINPATGDFIGTLGYTTAGEYDVQVTVTDGTASAVATFHWTVTNTNQPPVVTPQADRTNYEGDAIALSFPATDADGQSLTFSVTGLPAGLTFNPATGALTGTLGYETAGIYSVTVTANDGVTTRSVTFTWTVINVNRPPVVVNPGNKTSAEGAVIVLPISASDPDLDTLTYSATGLPPGLSINATTGVITGTVAYTAAPGPYTVTVRASDGTLFDEETFVWSITNVNRPPVVSAPNRTSILGATAAGQVVGSDPDGDALTYSATGLPPGAVMNTAGVISGVLTAPGVYTVTVTVKDPSNATGSGTFTWTVLANVPPVAVNDAVSSVGAAPVTIAVLANDSDSDGGTLSLTAITQPTGGASVGVVTTSGNQVVFTPAPGFVGTATFTYTISDGQGGTATATVTVTVTPAVCVSAGVALVRGTVMINSGSRTEGTIHVMTAADVTFNGGTLVGDLRMLGTPAITINGVPAAYAGTTNGTGASTPTSHRVTINSGTSLGWVVRRTDALALPTVSAPPSPAGTRAVNLNLPSDSPGSFATLRDLNLNSNVGPITVPAGTYGNFTANSGSSFVIGVVGATTPAVYNFEQLTLNTNSSLQVVGPVVVTLKNQAAFNGNAGSSAHREWLKLRIANAGLTLDSAVSFYGYVEAPNGAVIINGGTQLVGGLAANTLTLNSTGKLLLQTACNQPPTVTASDRINAEGDIVSVQISGSDPDGGTLTYTATGLPAGLSINPATGLITGTLGYATAGEYNVVVTVSDGSLTASAPFHWTVTNSNQPPVIALQSDRTNDEGTAINVTFTATDEDGTPLTFSAVGLPQGLTISPSGVVSGTISYDAAGPHSVTLTVTDGTVSRSITFNWTVINVNRPPVVVNPGTQTSAEGAVITRPISASDPDLDTLTYSATGLPPGLSINATTGVITGTVAYTAAPGPYTVTVKASDGSLFDTKTFQWIVTNTNRPPTAVADAATVPQGQSVVIAVLGNDSDPDGNGTISIQSATTPAQGSVVVNANGTITYTANATFSGPVTFNYTITDGTATASAQVTVTVTKVNHPPVVTNPGNKTSLTGAIVPLQIVGSDPDGDVITYSATGLPAGLSINASTGLITGTLSTTGVYTITVTVKDPSNLSASTTFTWTVTAPPACSASGYLTYSQGGWGNGGAPGQFLAAKWNQVYPGGSVTIGGTKTLKFTSANAIQAFLPAGGSAAVLTTSLVDPTSSSAGNLAAQLLALRLAVDFSAAGATKVGLGQLVMQSGPFAGQTVNQILATANAVLGGQTSALPSGVTIGGLNTVLESLNMNYHEGTVNNGLLGCTAVVVNRAPDAVNDAVTTKKNTAITIAVLANDTDQDGNTLSLTSVGSCAKGTMVKNSNGTITYTPTSNWTGTTTFTYSISDGKGGTDSATVTVTVKSS